MRLLQIKQSNKFKATLVALIMLTLSILYVIPLLNRGSIPYGDDISFNINRIQELVLNLKHGNWYPYLYTYQFNRVPDPLGICYPQLTTLPIAFLCLIFENEVVGICLGFAFCTFITMLIMYWVMRKLGRGRKTALVSAVVYSFSTYRTMTAVSRFDIGEFIAMAFIPATLYGLYAVMRKHSGTIALGLGLSMILLSHVLSAFLCLIFLLVEFVCLAATQKHWRQTLLALLKAVGLFVVSSAIWLVPFAEQIMFQKLSRPQTYDLSTTASSMSEAIINSLNNKLFFEGASRGTIGILLLVVIMYGLIHYRKLDQFARYSLVLGVATAVISTSLIPWGTLNNTPLDVIQFPFRLLMFSTGFLSMVAGDTFDQVLLKNGDTRGILIVSLFLVIGGLWYTGVKQYLDYRSITAPSLRMISGRQYAGGSYVADGSWHLTDYAPFDTTTSEWKHIYSHTATVGGHQFTIKNIVAKPDGLVYYDNRLKGSQVTLPVMMYKNVQLLQGSHQLKVNARGMVHLENTSSQPIEYKYVPSVADNVSRMVSIVTWCGIILYTFFVNCRQIVLPINRHR